MVRLLWASRALGWPAVDEALAQAYVRVILAGDSPYLDARQRRQLRRIARQGLLPARREARLQLPPGRPPKLTGAHAERAALAYWALLAFFQPPGHRPVPEHPDDLNLLRRLNDQLAAFSPIRALTLTDLSDLAEEAVPNRVAKLAVALAFAISPGTVEKVVARRRADTQPPASRSAKTTPEK